MLDIGSGGKWGQRKWMDGRNALCYYLIVHVFKGPGSLNNNCEQLSHFVQLDKLSKSPSRYILHDT